MAFHTCDEIQAFKEAFDAFDWNKSGTISYKSLQVKNRDHDDDDVVNDVADDDNLMIFMIMLMVKDHYDDDTDADDDDDKV